jgi:serine/threonine protein kinase
MPINAESASFLSHQFHERLGQAALEIQVMSNESLIENPNVISLLGVTFQASNHANGAITMTPVLIVELAELEKGSPITLDKYVLGSTRTLTLAEKTDLLLGIVRGLTALHSVGITHADLKPSNILMFPGKGGLLVPKLCDFGFVRLDGFEADIDGGTLYWAAPECLPTAPDRLKMVRHRVTRDIFSFGLVMWLVVFERLPFGPQNRWDQDYVAIVKLQNGMKDLLEKEFGRSFHLRVRLPEHIDETDLDEEGKTEDKGMMTRLSDLGVLDEVRFDQRLHRWMEETSGIQHLMRRVMSICLRTNPEKRSMALSLFAKEAASKRYGR